MNEPHRRGRWAWARLAPALDFLGRYHRRVTAAAAVLVLVVGAGYSASLGSQLRFPDERDYWAIATHLARSATYSLDGVSATAFRPPGYPTFLAALQVLGLGIPGARMANFIMLALSVIGISMLAGRVAGPRAAALTAGVAAVYPLSLYTAGTLYSQTMAGCFFLWALVSLVWSLTATSGRRRLSLASAGGVLFSICVLTVPTFGASLLLVLVWMVVRRRRQALPLVAAGLIAAALLPSAWTIRNAVVFHALVPVSTNNGLNLLEGNSATTNPTAGNLTDLSAYSATAHQYSTEVERSEFYGRTALMWIGDHKARAAVLYLEKVANYFNPRNDLVTANQQSKVNDAIAVVTYVPLLLLFIARLALFRRYRITPLEALLIALYVGNAFVMAIYYTKVRYRVPLDPLLVLVAASLVVGLASRARDSVRPSPASGPPGDASSGGYPANVHG